jgi:hypothetical protein
MLGLATHFARQAADLRDRATTLETQLREAEQRAASLVTELQEQSGVLDLAQAELAEIQNQSTQQQQQISRIQGKLDKSVTKEQASRSESLIAQEEAKMTRDLVARLIGEIKFAPRQQRAPDFLVPLNNVAGKIDITRNSVAAGRVLMYLSQIFKSHGDFEASQRAAGRAVEAYRKGLPDDLNSILAALLMQGESMYMCGRFEEGIAVLNEVAEQCRQDRTARKVELRRALELTWYCLEDLNREDEVEPILRERWELYRSGSSDNMQLRTLGDLAMFLLKRSQLEESESMWRLMLTKARESQGEDATMTFDAQCGLAWALHVQGRKKEVEAMHTAIFELAEFMEKIMQPFSSTTYPWYLMERGDLGKAELYLREAWREVATSRNTGADRNRKLRPLVTLYERMGNERRAQVYRDQIVAPVTGSASESSAATVPGDHG